ncbi:MAG: GTPase HflX [Gammaproteobacteria bacterium]|nr:GTPase HflX [Gammaproteobacteria bacterium]
MIDRPKGGEQAVLVHIDFPDEGMQEDQAEFEELARSAGANIVGVVTGTRHAPEPKYFIGTGKAEEIREYVKAHNAELVLFNHQLAPAQERNLERFLECRVLDRTGLILDIFAQRARSFEGKLQVELALLKHMATRLVRGWTHLERQGGGIGLRGPGETQLETDRRLIRGRIKLISQRIIKVRKQRDLSRRARQKAVIPTVAIVGYTNAGKSTLFNSLCGTDVFAANQLFATLDPTLRKLEVPDLGSVILADTVGFIRHLPHDLVDAFRATLEEVCAANLLIHVVDVHDSRMQENISEVNEVLESIGAGEIPQIIVFNKIDLCPHLSPHVETIQGENITRVWVSAHKKQGLDELKACVSHILGQDLVQKTLVLQPKDARLRAVLYGKKAVISETIDETGNCRIIVRLSPADLEKFFSEFLE